MNVSAASGTCRKDIISRQSGELPSQTLTVDVNPFLLTERVPAQYALFESIKHQRYRQALLLVEAGVQIDGRNDKGQTPLVCICTSIESSKLRAKFVQLLLDAGADPNLQDWKGMSALMHAAALGLMEVLLLLLDHPQVDVYLEDQNGNTALLHACLQNRCKSVAIILKSCKNREIPIATVLDHKNIDGSTAFDLALSVNDQDIVHLLSIAQNNPDQLKTLTVLPDKEEITSRAENDGGQDLNFLDVVIFENTCELPDITNNGSETKTSSKLYNKVKKLNSRVSILPLLSLDGVSGESWELDFGKSKTSKREMGTGSKSLNETYTKEFHEPSKNTQSLSAGRNSINNVSLNLAKSQQHVHENSQNTKKDIHLPPIKCTLLDYKTITNSLKATDFKNKKCG